MKCVTLQRQDLTYLSKALLENLFPRPIIGELLVFEDLKNENCVLYFQETYFENLTSSIHEKYIKGDFIRSNSEKEWVHLMNSINSAETTNEDVSNLRSYWLSTDPTKPKIGIDKEILTKILSSDLSQYKTAQEKYPALRKNLEDVYVGHKIECNWYLIEIERDIEQNSPMVTKIDLLPAITLISKYGFTIEDIEIYKGWKTETIATSIHVE